jgi:hypothetical protein
MARDESGTGKLLENPALLLWTAGKEGVIQKPRDFGRFRHSFPENFGDFDGVAVCSLENFCQENGNG